MSTKERIQQTCVKAHRFTVGSCIACERDELLTALQNLLAFVEGEFPSASEDDCNVLAAWAAIRKATE